MKSFSVATLHVDSEALKGNPLGDPHVRKNPMLLPKGDTPKGGWPIVFVLSGFAGNGTKAFNEKGFEQNYPQEIDDLASRGKAPLAVYIFVDAWTKWGGSQFINSNSVGSYEDYIACDLVAGVKDYVEASDKPENWIVVGGSSGGYGALHLGSRYPNVFGRVAAIAPDSFFEASLLPDIYKALPVIHKMGGLQEVKSSLEEGKLLNSRSGFSVLNAIAMCRCYLPMDNKEGFEFPVDIDTGVRIEERWQRLKEQDPVVFLHQRKDKVEKLKAIYVDVGLFDQYNLQFGGRQIRQCLRPMGVDLTYTEFEGSHNDLGKRRPQMLEWLDKQLSQ
ncbi:MAG: alpha/beta hydrolase-fold protein [Pseudomonadota bacterium]